MTDPRSPRAPRSTLPRGPFNAARCFQYLCCLGLRTDERVNQTLALIVTVTKRLAKQKRHFGTIPCPRCEGTIRYARSSKHHHRGLCETPDCIGWMV